MKRQIRSIISVILVVIMAVGVLPVNQINKVEAADATITVKVTACYDLAYEVLGYVNSERKKAGLNELTMDVSLLESAMQRAAESVVTGSAYETNEISDSVAHTRPDGTSSFTINNLIYGENIAFGQKDAFTVMYGNSSSIDPNSSSDMNQTSWMRCQGHRSNILTSSWKSVGIGMVKYNGEYYYYWSQEFSPYSATPATKRTDRITRNFSVGVSSNVYNKLVSKGKLSSLTNGGVTNNSNSSNGSSSSGGSSSGSSMSTKAVSGTWKQTNGRWWFQVGNGWLSNSWLKSGGTWYAFGSDGYMYTGWKKIDGDWYYFDSSGAMASGEWRDGYWLSSNGKWSYQYTGSWHVGSKGWWYGDSSGWYAQNQWQKINGSWYYFDANGWMVTNTRIQGYWIGADGVCQ